MENVILSPITRDELKLDIADTLKKEFQIFLSSFQPPIEKKTELRTRKQSASFLGVSLVTLNKWQKEGLLKSYRIGSRIRFKQCELEGALSQIKTRR